MHTPYTLLASTHTADDVSDEVREALLAHLEGLFSLAQVVTMNAEGAIRLVEATYQTAYARLSGAAVPDDPKTWLYALLLEEHAGRTQDPSATPESQPPDAPPPKAVDDFRRRLAEQFVHQALPTAFSTLPPDRRLLLMLCYAQSLSTADAGRIVGLSAEQAAASLEQARAELHAALYDNATETERHLLATSLPPNWDRAALVHLAETELVPLPPTLRPAVHAPAARDPQPLPPSPADEAARAPAWNRIATRLTATLLIIMVAGTMGYVFSELLRVEPETNLLNLSVAQSGAAEPGLPTGDPTEAERLVRERLGWRLMVPIIDQATLAGVDVREITDGVTVPVFVYTDDPTGQPITLYAYTYTLLDRHADRIRLERDILQQIEEDGNFDLYDLGEVRVLIWRYRDEIFVAVTPVAVADLRERIAFPS